MGDPEGQSAWNMPLGDQVDDRLDGCLQDRSHTLNTAKMVHEGCITHGMSLDTPSFSEQVTIHSSMRHTRRSCPHKDKWNSQDGIPRGERPQESTEGPEAHHQHPCLSIHEQDLFGPRKTRRSTEIRTSHNPRESRTRRDLMPSSDFGSHCTFGAYVHWAGWSHGALLIYH